MLLLIAASTGMAQNVANDHCVRYALIPQTVMRPQKVTSYKWVEETKYETEKVTTMKPVWKTEQKERTTVSYKPVVKTKFREQRVVEYERVVETSFKEITEEKTVYETVTEMRDQERIVETPIVETSYRDEKYVVRKPVTETQMQSENVTVYRPQTTSHTTYVPTVTPVNQLVYQPGRTRNRLQFLRPGYYPNSNGQMAYKTGGLYWVPQQNAGGYQVQTQNVVGYTPQQINQTTLVPETVTRQKPVEITRYVDTVETRRVPIKTQRMKREVITEKVPVTVRKPRIVRTTRKEPIETVRLVPKEVVKKIPYQETTYERVETKEPYEERTQSWVSETSERIVPRKVYRRVPVESTQMVPVREVRRVPVDSFGNPIMDPNRIEVLEMQRPVTSGRTYQGELRVVDEPLQVVESSTLDNNGIVRVESRKVYVDPKDLVTVERRPLTEDDVNRNNKTEAQKPASVLKKDDTSGSGSDKVDVKKSDESSRNPNLLPADTAPKVDAKGGQGKLNGPNNDA